MNGHLFIYSFVIISVITISNKRDVLNLIQCFVYMKNHHCFIGAHVGTSLIVILTTLRRSAHSATLTLAHLEWSFPRSAHLATPITGRHRKDPSVTHSPERWFCESPVNSYCALCLCFQCLCVCSLICDVILAYSVFVYVTWLQSVLINRSVSVWMVPHFSIFGQFHCICHSKC